VTPPNPSRAPERSPHHPSYRLPRNVEPDRYELMFVPDLVAASFEGSAVIDIRVLTPVTTVVLNAADLAVTAAELSAPDWPPRPATIFYRPEVEQLVLTWPSPVAVGHWRLRLQFTGQLNDRLRGFYRSTYRRADGALEVLAATQFEAAEARRAFPCWDEPDRKATFQITLVVDSALTALSNTRQVADESAGPGKRRVTFAETMRMSPYLVAMVVGRLAQTPPVVVDRVPIRLLARPEQLHRLGLATEAAAHAVRFFQEYFGIAYPGDKLDHVAIPDFAYGAMENLGCIIYRETALLADPVRAAQSERHGVVATIAHETAHMWFGDLVTMRWWNGLWLNEAFATFMQLLATDAWDPSWDVWTAFGRSRAAALATDGLASTRPVEAPVGPATEAMAMADVLTYSKGAAILRMMEQYLTPQVFRRGIAGYLDRHRYGNTDTSDLWDALEEASGEPVRRVMDAWVQQGGYPLVTADVAGPGAPVLSLSQEPFRYQGSGDRAASWTVPMVIGLTGADGAPLDPIRVLLGPDPLTVPLPEGWRSLSANHGAFGYYRVNYGPSLRTALVAHFHELGAAERLAVANDAWALILAGQAPLASVTPLWLTLRQERDVDVWSAVADTWELMAQGAGPTDRTGLAAYVRAVAGPVLSELGWTATPGEASRTALLRARLVNLLGTVGEDDAVQEQARRRLTAHAVGTEPAPPDLLGALIRVVAASGGSDAWTLVHRAALAADTPQNERRYLAALALFRDPALVERTLAVYLSDEVRRQDTLGLVGSLLGETHAAAATWTMIEQRWDTLTRDYPPMAVSGALLSRVAWITDDQLVERVTNWLTSHPLAEAPRAVARVLERSAIHRALWSRLRGTLVKDLAIFAPETVHE